MFQIDAKTATVVERKRRTASEWSQIMSDYEASGLTQRRFCDERGVAYSSFCNWRKRLTQEDAASPLIELPMELSLVKTPGSMSPVSDWRVELELGQGIVVRIR